MKHILLILFCVTLFLFFSCSPRYQSEQIYETERLLSVAPDSALYIIENLLPYYSELSDTEKAYLGILYYSAINKTYGRYPALEFIDNSTQYYRNKRNRTLLAQALFYKSRAYQQRYLYRDASELLFEALEYVAVNDYSLLGRIRYDQGSIYYMLGELDNAIIYHEQALSYLKRTDDYYKQARVLLSAAITYRELADNYIRANELVRQALSISDAAAIKSGAFHQLSEYYLHIQAYDSAKIYMRQSIEFVLEKYLALRYIDLADIYFEQQQYDSVLYYANAALPYVVDYFDKNGYYRILAKVAFAKDDYETGSGYLQQYHLYRDSIKMIENQPTLSLVQELHVSKTEASKIRRNNTLIVAAVIIILLLSIYWGIYFRRKWKKHHARKEKQYAKQEQQQINKEKELTIRQKIIIHQELLGRIHELQKAQAVERKKMTFSQKEEADIAIYKQILQYDKKDLFFEKINHFFNHFPDVLKRDYPTLATDDVMCCCLFLIGLKTSEIALILDIKEDSVRKKRQRIAKKMDFNSVDEFEIYLKGFKCQ
jgi:tetratricopeptide (TPR) repeat protein